MKLPTRITSALLALGIALSLVACGSAESVSSSTSLSDTDSVASIVSTALPDPAPTPDPTSEPTTSPTAAPSTSSAFSLSDVPAYSGSPYVIVNDNIPFFFAEDLTTDPFETYSPLDSLGRCSVAFANVCQDIMPTEERESISEVTPTGWVNNTYDCVDGGYLYNRCHLIGFQLAGENANEKNLITGTRSMNVDGMLPFENMVADYVTETSNHVLYRVTPIFEGNNLLASGVLMEALSVEDQGEGIQYCVYCYNVQDGVVIDYATGENHALNDSQESTPPSTVQQETDNQDTVETQNYVLNTNTKKFHYPSCRSVKQMSDKNRQDVVANRDELIAQGYDPCGNCDP